MRCTDAHMVGLAVAVALVAPAAARAEDLPTPKSATPVPVSAATIQLQGEEHFHAEDHETADATGCAPSTVVDASASGSLSSRMTGVATTSWGAALENAKTTGHGSESGTITETKCVVDYASGDEHAETTQTPCGETWNYAGGGATVLRTHPSWLAPGAALVAPDAQSWAIVVRLDGNALVDRPEGAPPRCNDTVRLKTITARTSAPYAGPRLTADADVASDDAMNAPYVDPSSCSQDCSDTMHWSGHVHVDPGTGIDYPEDAGYQGTEDGARVPATITAVAGPLVDEADVRHDPDRQSVQELVDVRWTTGCTLPPGGENAKFRDLITVSDLRAGEARADYGMDVTGLLHYAAGMRIRVQPGEQLKVSVQAYCASRTGKNVGVASTPITLKPYIAIPDVSKTHLGFGHVGPVPHGRDSELVIDTQCGMHDPSLPGVSHNKCTLHIRGPGVRVDRLATGGEQAGRHFRQRVHPTARGKLRVWVTSEPAHGVSNTRVLRVV